MIAMPYSDITAHPPGEAEACQTLPLQDIPQLDLATLVRYCRYEYEFFQQRSINCSTYAYELLRRALSLRDEAAWNALFILYRPLVEHWVCSNPAFSASGESSDVLVCDAFTRFWSAIPPARFAQFSSAAALLRYLQICTSCVVIDHVRLNARYAHSSAYALAQDTQHSPDEEVLAHMQRHAIWQHISSRITDTAERVVIFDSFVRGLKPSDIWKQRRELFAQVKDVYMIKRNVLERLSRDQALRALIG